MSRRHFLALFGTGLLVVALSGCTSFAPVYGGASGAGLASARFNFAPPTNRLEQIMLNRLSIAFPSAAGPDDPVLRVSASSSAPAAALSNALATGSPANIRVEATVTILDDGQTVFSATRFSDSAYQSGKLSPTEQASAEGVREAVAENTAEALRLAILAGYRPGVVSTQPR